MAIEINSSNIICSKCGKSYGRRKGYFPVSYSILYKGIGYMTVCKDCIDEMYDKFVTACGDAKQAVRQMCRKLDLFWSDSVYEVVARKSTTKTMMTSYIAKINTVTYAGKSYDDTLAAEGSLWNFGTDDSELSGTKAVPTAASADEEIGDEEVDPKVVSFWGPGFTPSMYAELEERFKYWMSRYPDDAELDIGTEALIRQICNLEITINQDRALGKPIDKHVNALNTLLGSASLKPAQKKQEDVDAALSNTPLGVWLYRYENKRPLPELDEEFKDVNGIKRYIHTWVTGHLAKMLGLKNYYSKMYEDEISKYTVERPEYDDDDEDDDVLSDIFGGVNPDEQN